MLNYDALYEAELRMRAIVNSGHTNPAPKLPADDRSVSVRFREWMVRLGDLLIDLGCELQVRFLTESRPRPCAA
jgi:hypothetical protein